MNESERSERVLVVEDEPDIAALIAYQLTKAGYRVETASTGAEGLAAIGREAPDLLILDRMMPGISGDEVLRSVRAEPSTEALPVLILTARREQEDRIEGLELGADDYLTKPFSPRELVLRARAILRRSHEGTGGGGAGVLKIGGVRLDLDAYEASVDGEEVNLTPTEFRLLRALMDRPGRTQSRQQLLERAWEVDAVVSDKIHTRTVDMHVRRLRTKLGKTGDWIKTIRGFGYRLRVPESEKR